MKPRYRVLRLVEYEGDLEWIRYQLAQSIHGEKIVPPSGEYNNYPRSHVPQHEGGTIRVSTLGHVPALLTLEEEGEETA